MLAGRFSNDGLRLALLTGEQLHVVSVEGGSTLRIGRSAWRTPNGLELGRAFRRLPGIAGHMGCRYLQRRDEELLVNMTFTGLEMLPVGES